MQKRWNEEVVELLKDLHDLKSAETTSIQEITDVLLSWVEQYFLQNNFKDSEILSYRKISNNHLRVTVLQKRLMIVVDGFSGSIKINEINKSDDISTFMEFYIGTFKCKEKKVLSRKILFEILDAFSKNAVEIYEKNEVYI